MALLLSYLLNVNYVTTLSSWKHPARLRSQEITADEIIILQLSGTKCQLAEDMLSCRRQYGSFRSACQVSESVR